MGEKVQVMEDLIRHKECLAFPVKIPSPFPRISIRIPFTTVLRMSVGAGGEAERPVRRLFQESKYDMRVA